MHWEHERTRYRTYLVGGFCAAWACEDHTCYREDHGLQTERLLLFSSRYKIARSDAYDFCGHNLICVYSSWSQQVSF